MTTMTMAKTEAHKYGRTHQREREGALKTKKIMNSPMKKVLDNSNVMLELYSNGHTNK